jgi:phage protein D
MAGDQSASEQTFAALGDAQEAIVRAPVATQAEADQLAADRFNAASLDFIRAEGLARGRTDIRAGRVIQLDELGARFSGDYYVTSAVHRFSRRDGYLTDFRARRNAS